MNYQRGNSYTFTCRKACSIHKTQKMLLLSYLMEKTLSLNDDESVYIYIYMYSYICVCLVILIIYFMKGMLEDVYESWKLRKIYILI